MVRQPLRGIFDGRALVCPEFMARAIQHLQLDTRIADRDALQKHIRSLRGHASVAQNRARREPRRKPVHDARGVRRSLVQPPLLLRDALLHGRALQGRSAERVAGSEEGSDWLEGRDPGAATGDGAQVATRSGRRSGRKVKAST